MDIFEKALEWYQSGNSGKREAALELFSKKELEKEIDRFNEKKLKETLKAREEHLKKTFDRCKKLFPIGTPMWSDEGTDNCVNIVVSEPYIEETQYSVPCGAYDYSYTGKKKSIFAKTIRIGTINNEPLEGNWKYDTINLEKCLYDMDNKSEWGHKEHIINLNEYYKVRNEERTSKIKWLKEKVERDQKDLNEKIDELNAWEEYKPEGLTKELINEIVKKYGK